MGTRRLRRSMWYASGLSLMRVTPSGRRTISVDPCAWGSLIARKLSTLCRTQSCGTLGPMLAYLAGCVKPWRDVAGGCVTFLHASVDTEKYPQTGNSPMGLAPACTFGAALRIWPCSARILGGMRSILRAMSSLVSTKWLTSPTCAGRRTGLSSPGPLQPCWRWRLSCGRN